MTTTKAHNCGRAGCDQPGTHYIAAKVWARGHPKTSVPITTVIGMQFCETHAGDEVRDKALIQPAFWDAIDGHTNRLQVLPVDRASLELEAIQGDADEAIGMGGVNAPSSRTAN